MIKLFVPDFKLEDHLRVVPTACNESNISRHILINNGGESLNVFVAPLEDLTQGFSVESVAEAPISQRGTERVTKESSG